MTRTNCAAARLGVRCLTAMALAVGLPLASAQAQQVSLTVTSTRHGVTPALRNFVPGLHARPNAPFHVMPLGRPIPVTPVEGKGGTHPGHGKGKGGGSTSWTDPDYAAPTGTTALSTQGSTFQGISANGYIPPDPNLAVSSGTSSISPQVVQIVNVEFAVWNTPSFTSNSPTQTMPAEPIHTIFTGLGSRDLCATTDGGDPIVLWDNSDKRWIVSQLAYNNSLNNDHWCLAISDSADAAGPYSVYDFSFGSSFPDYPKVGIWNAGGHSGVYESFNIFAKGKTFQGAEACGFPLTDVASPPAQLTLVCVRGSTSVYSILPADVDGTTPPPGEPEMYMQFLASGGTGNALALYRFTPNFAASTATLTLYKSIPVGTYHEACGGGSCIPQPGTSEQLDSLGDRLMYRLAYRNMTNGDSLLVDQSVQVSSAGNQTGIRWYQIDDPTGSTTSVVQGTYSPPDPAGASPTYRWMGSIAEDQYGDIGLGYSFSSATSYPGIAFAGREPGESPANALEPETVIWNGSGSQTSYNRWGDYTDMAVDPSDDCTFWYTDEYEPATGSFNWKTVIASFRFPNCGN